MQGHGEFELSELGKEQAENFPNATFYEVKGSHHNDLFYLSGREICDLRIMEGDVRPTEK